MLKELVEDYGVKVDLDIHKEVLARSKYLIVLRMVALLILDIH